MRRISHLQALDRYGIHLLFVEGQSPRYPLLRSGAEAPLGPRGFAIDIERHTVYAHAIHDRPVGTAPAAIWHEACHIICHPPGMDIYAVPETAMLMQFERSLAAHCFYRHALKDVIEYQENTFIDEYLRDGRRIEYLRDAHDEVEVHGWRRGYRLARKVGLLDATLCPTFRWPDWSKLSKKDWEAFA